MDTQNINISGAWIRSSRCGPQHNCVELIYDGAGIVVRDSKREPTSVLTFDQESWSTFVLRCRSML